MSKLARRIMWAGLLMGVSAAGLLYVCSLHALHALYVLCVLQALYVLCVPCVLCVLCVLHVLCLLCVPCVLGVLGASCVMCVLCVPDVHTVHRSPNTHNDPVPPSTVGSYTLNLLKVLGRWPGWRNIYLKTWQKDFLILSPKHLTGQRSGAREKSQKKRLVY